VVNAITFPYAVLSASDPRGFPKRLNYMTPELAHSEVKTKPSEELDLVHASKRGNLAAFETLVKKYDRKLLRIANSVTHNIEDSQDAVQEAFFKAYQHLGEFREACQFSTWLIRITLNQSLMRLRRQRFVREVPLDENCRPEKDIAPTEIADRTPNPEQLCWASEFRDILAQTLEEGRPSLRVVFVLREIKGPFDRPDINRSRSASRRCKGQALASSVAASGRFERTLQTKHRRRKQPGLTSSPNQEIGLSYRCRVGQAFCGQAQRGSN
jgi:RNA polymerase sigma-70 factor (ECF subfamily)